MYVTGLFANRMRSASVFWYPPFCADADSCIINTGTADVEIINVSLLLIGICDGTFQNLVNHCCCTFSCELQDIHSILDASAHYLLDGLEFTFWVKNLTDEVYDLWVVDSGMAVLGSSSVQAPPRSFGVAFRVDL